MKTPGRNGNLPADSHAYERLADAIRQDILDGVYKHGDRIPTETALSKSTGLSALTVRQALGLLVEDGILERFIGRGTFVKELSWHGASFSIDGLVQQISREDTRVRIVRTEVRRASADIAAALDLSLGDSVIYLKRTIASPAGVFLVQEGHIKPDPRRPVLEAELGATYLNGLFTGGGEDLIKMARLFIDPVVLSPEDAALLNRPTGSAAFRLEYVFFDSESSPLASGFFTTPQGVLRLNATIGIKGKPGAKNGKH